MYFLLQNICEMPELNPIWEVVGFIVKAIWFGIPILLIIFGMIDLGKAVIASKEDEVKKAWKAFGRRFLVAVAVFAVVWIVTIVLNMVTKLSLPDGTTGGTVNTSGWETCWCKISKGSNNSKCK